MSDPHRLQRFVDAQDQGATHGGRSAEEIMGEVDAVKLRSSMTLFARASGPGSVFEQVLDRFFDGAPGPATEERL